MPRNAPPSPPLRPPHAGARRALAALAAFAAAGLLAAPQAQADAGPRAVATVGLRVLVPRIVQLQLLAQPHEFEITAADVARGYVDTRYEMQLSVFSNQREGYTLAFSKHGESVARAVLSGPGSELRLDSAMATLARPAGRPGMHQDQLAFGVRLHLSAAARPGHYPWPIQVAALSL